GLTPLGASNGGQLQSGAVVWSVGSLAPGASANVSVQAQVPAATTGNTSLTNVAQARSNEIVNAIASNTVTVAVTAPSAAPRLQLTKAASPLAVQAGGSINYSITATNAGNGAATNVQIRDPGPPGPTVHRVSTAGAPADTTTRGWHLGQLAPAAPRPVNFRARA